jgi:hypothetical protein
MVGGAVCGLEAACLEEVYIRGHGNGEHATPDALLPLSYALGSRAPQLRSLEVHDTSLHNVPFVSMCQGLEHGSWYGLIKLQLSNCLLTVDDLKVFTAALGTMKSAVFHRLLSCLKTRHWAQAVGRSLLACFTGPPCFRVSFALHVPLVEALVCRWMHAGSRIKESCY